MKVLNKIKSFILGSYAESYSKHYSYLHFVLWGYFYYLTIC
ncbi:hypothetical protein PROVRETT_07132 [Providencia rettgeri DSM 1131]|nr:hypothetical protein PROVRETT_07132 [Providencia rettgeri DSM 1131]